MGEAINGHASERLLFGPEAAAAVYREIAEDLCISDYSLAGGSWKGNILLRHVLEPLGWLGPIMLQADELSTVLLGSRVWDVAYQANSKSLEGVTPVPLATISGSGTHDSYARIPHAGSRSVIVSMLNRLALHRKITVDHDARTVKLRPIQGYYPNVGPLEHGDYLEFPSEGMVLHGAWQSFLGEASSSHPLQQLIAQHQAPQAEAK